MRTRIIAALELGLIFPAAIFLAAVAVPSLISQPVPGAHGLVLWYSQRLWTLWILLLALPLTAFITGCTVLLRLRPNWGTLSVAVATVGAGGVLVIVLLHILAN